MKGTNVCRLHGGAAPQVRRRAEQRILEASDKAAFTLVQLMQDPKTADAIKLAAARDLLDRAGLTSKRELEIDVKVSKFDQVAGDIVMDLDFDDPEIEDAEIVEDEKPSRAPRRPLVAKSDEQIDSEHIQRVRAARRSNRRKG